MSRNARIQKRQTAIRKQTTKLRNKDAHPVEVRMIEIPLGKMLKDLADKFAADKTTTEMPKPAGPSLDKVRFNPDAGNLRNGIIPMASETANNKLAEPPSIQNQAQLADKWAYEVRMQLSQLVARIGGSEAVKANGKASAASTGEELTSGLRGTLKSATISLSQSLDLLSTLRMILD